MSTWAEHSARQNPDGSVSVQFGQPMTRAAIQDLKAEPAGKYTLQCGHHVDIYSVPLPNDTRSLFCGECRTKQAIVDRANAVPRPHGELRVWFDPASADQVRMVQLYLDAGITESTLRRFPWQRWLAAADAYLQLMRWTDGKGQPIPNLGRVIDRVQSPQSAKRPPQRSVKPAKHVLPDEHYQQVARRYQELTAAGHQNPTAIIAKEYVVGRSTSASWIRRARDRDMLAPARRGKAG